MCGLILCQSSLRKTTMDYWSDDILSILLKLKQQIQCNAFPGIFFFLFLLLLFILLSSLLKKKGWFFWYFGSPYSFSKVPLPSRWLLVYNVTVLHATQLQRHGFCLFVCCLFLFSMPFFLATVIFISCLIWDFSFKLKKKKEYIEGKLLLWSFLEHKTSKSFKGQFLTSFLFL